MKKIVRLLSVFFLSFAFFSGSYPSMAEDPQGDEWDESLPEEYVIEKGDTLWDISERFLKDPFKWPAVWDRNEYINNPDLIFPGNKLKFFTMGKKEVEPQEEAVVVEKKELPIEPPQQVKVEEPPPPPPKKYGLIPLYKNTDFLESAGFIEEEEGEIGYISHSFKKGNHFNEGDKAGLKFVNYKPGMGERFVIYSILENVKHPKTKEKVGNLVNVLGRLKLMKSDTGVYMASITKIYDIISTGDKIRKYEEIPVPLVDPSATPPIKNISGYIVAAKDKRQHVGDNSVIYVDSGREDGVAAGDLFEVFQEVPALRKTERGVEKDDPPLILKEKVGEFRVLTVRSKTSTGWVVKSLREIGIGEIIRYAAFE